MIDKITPSPRINGTVSVQEAGPVENIALEGQTSQQAFLGDYGEALVQEITSKSKFDGITDLLPSNSSEKIKEVNFKKMVSLLRQGKIPSSMEEEWRLVPFSSKEGQDFNEQITEFLRTYYTSIVDKKNLFKNHDFTKTPIRFMISKQQDPNAWYLKYSQPPTIVLTEGMFIKEDGQLFIKDPEHLLFVLCHEMTHYKIQEIYGEDIHNSKQNEGFSYSMPIQIMIDFGLDPNKAVDFYKQSFKPKRRDFIMEVLDVHPFYETTVSILSDTLAIEKAKRGTIQPTVFLESFTGNESPFQCVRSSSHESFLQSRIELKSPNYRGLSVSEKLDILSEIMDDVVGTYSVRLEDLCDEIEKLKPQVVRSDYEKIDRMADKVLDVIDNNQGINKYQELYFSLASLQGDKKKPIGRLKKISVVCRDLVESTLERGVERDEKKQNIITSASDLVRIYDTEPLCSTEYGRSFIRKIKLPKFTFPDVDNLEYKVRKGKEPKVEWHPLRYLALTDDNVLKSCFLMGVGVEEKMLWCVYRNSAFALDLFPSSDNLAINSLDGGKIEEVDIDKKGCVTLYDTSRGKSLFEDHKSQQLVGIYETKLQLGEELTDRDMNLLHTLGNFSRGETLINLMPYILKSRQVENAKKLIRDMYSIREAGWQKVIGYIKEFYESDPSSNRELVRDIFRSDCWQLCSLDSSYVKFVHRDECRLFSEEEKKQIIINFIRFHLSAGIELINPNYESEKKSFIVINEVANDLKLNCRVEKNSWEEVLKTLRRGKANRSEKSQDSEELMNIGFSSCMASMLIQRNKCPNIKQLEEFIRLGGDIYGSEAKTKFKRFIETHLSGLDSFNLCDFANIYVTLSRSDLIPSHNNDQIVGSLIDRLRNEENIENRINFSLLILSGKRVDNPKLRECLESILIDSVSKKYGIDDNATPKFKNLSKIVDKICDGLPKTDQSSVLQQIVKKIQAQRKILSYIRVKQKKDEKKFFELTSLGHAMDCFVDVLRRNHVFRKNLLDYLISPYTEKSRDSFIINYDQIFALLTKDESSLTDEIAYNKYHGYDYLEENVPVEDLVAHNQHKKKIRKFVEDIYENFWAASVEYRTFMTRELLGKSEDGVVDKDTFAYVIGKTFSSDQEGIEHIRDFIENYVNSMEPFERHLALSALMTSNKKNESEEVPSIGKTAATLLENLGPAEIKVGQGVRCHPNVRKDIRADFKRLTYNANEPYRWDIVEMIEDRREAIEKIYSTSVKSSKKLSIKHIGDVIGSGSLYVAVELIMSDGSTQVIAIKRPYAESKAVNGFRLLRETTFKVSNDNPSKDTLIDLLEEGEKKVLVETDVTTTEKQFDLAGDMYDGISVEMDNEVFPFSACKLNGVGEDFFLMDKAEGVHFAELSEDPSNIEHKKKLSSCILTLEINNLLNGRFDNDRHEGNIKVSGNNVTHIDFKALSLQKWTKEGYEQLTNLILQAILESPSVSDFSEILLSKQRELKETGVQLDPLVHEAQKALLSLGEYTEQLTQDELIRVLVSAFANGVHPDVKETVLKQPIFEHIPQYKEMFRNLLERGELPSDLLPGLTSEKLIKINRSLVVAV